jgi:hypothetical protein
MLYIRFSKKLYALHSDWDKLVEVLSWFTSVHTSVELIMRPERGSGRPSSSNAKISFQPPSMSS